MIQIKKVGMMLCGLFVLAVTILACGTGDANTGTNAADSTSSSEEQQSTEKFKVNDVVKVGDTWEVTVNEVKTLTNDGEFLTPKADHVYLVVNVTTKNVSAEEGSISSLAHFSIKGADGTKYTQTILVSETAAPDGKVEPGGLLTGNLAYEVPVGENAFILSFAPDILAGGQTQWDITI